MVADEENLSEATSQNPILQSSDEGNSDTALGGSSRESDRLEESLVKQMAAKAGLTEQMKAEDMMKWVGLMNNIRNSAQEIVKNR